MSRTATRRPASRRPEARGLIALRDVVCQGRKDRLKEPVLSAQFVNTKKSRLTLMGGLWHSLCRKMARPAAQRRATGGPVPRRRTTRSAS